MNSLNPSPSASSSAPAARCGKIARLPAAIRDALNRRLENNEPAAAILPWLNGLAETKQVLASHFAGAPISPQNLSDWRQGGFREWLLRRQLVEHADSLTETASSVQGRKPPQTLVDNLALVLAARYAALLNRWDGAITPELEAEVQMLRALNRDVVQLQKSMHHAIAQNAKIEAEEAARREVQAEKERKRKVLPLQVQESYHFHTQFQPPERVRLKTALTHSLTLEEVDALCGLQSSRIVPNQATAPNRGVDTATAPSVAAGCAP